MGTKEYKSYIEERAELQQELTKIQSKEMEGREKEAELKKQGQAIEETLAVLKDVRTRLIETFDTVSELLEGGSAPQLRELRGRSSRRPKKIWSPPKPSSTRRWRTEEGGVMYCTVLKSRAFSQ